VAHDTPSCNDRDCCSAVCVVDPFCCEQAWDGGCVALVIEHCPKVAEACEPSCSADGMFGFSGEFCGGPGLGGCSCDPACAAFSDCCSTVCQQCPRTETCFRQPWSCFGLCGGPTGLCWCDAACGEFNDCCPDVCLKCAEHVKVGAFFDCNQPGFGCTFYCGGFNPIDHCFCDAACFDFGDCCDDMCLACGNYIPCPPPTCAGACGGLSSTGCFCDDSCFAFNDCCPDICAECPRLSGCPDSCPADFDDSGSVDGVDLGQLLLRWGKCINATECSQDLTSDGKVDGRDLGQLLLEWGACRG
jgi:hypothetical protein